MNSSAVDVTTSESPAYTRRIEIRLTRPAPRVRYEKGKMTKEEGSDMERVIAKIQPELEVALQSLYGSQTEVLITLGQAADIRFQGQFKEKASVMRDVIEDLLSNVFEHLELEEE